MSKDLYVVSNGHVCWIYVFINMCLFFVKEESSHFDIFCFRYLSVLQYMNSDPSVPFQYTQGFRRDQEEGGEAGPSS